MCTRYILAKVSNWKEVISNLSSVPSIAQSPSLDEIIKVTANFIKDNIQEKWSIVSEKTCLTFENTYGVTLLLFANDSSGWVSMTHQDIEKAKLHIFAELDL